MTTKNNKGEHLSGFPNNYTVIDIETTGLSAVKNEIIELSALKIRNNKVVGEFSTLVKPQGYVSSFITKLTGITPKMLDFAPEITVVLPEFMKFVQDDIILGHNINFDIGFIYENCKKYLNHEFCNNYVDTMRLSRKYCQLTSNKLQNVAAHYKVDTLGHHRALTDCKITNNVYIKIKEEFECPPSQTSLEI